MKDLIQQRQPENPAKKLKWFLRGMFACGVLGLAIDGIWYLQQLKDASCQQIDLKNIDDCADYQKEETVLLDRMVELSKLPNVPPLLRTEMEERVKVADRLMADTGVDKKFYEFRRLNQTNAVTYSTPFIKGRANLTFLLTPKKDGRPTDLAMGIMAHEFYYHGTVAYLRVNGLINSGYKDEADKKRQKAEEEYQADYFGNCIEALARRNGDTAVQDLKEDKKTFGMVGSEVAFRLAEKGYDGGSKLWQMIYDRSLEYLWSKGKRDEQGRPIYLKFAGEDELKEMEAIEKRWNDFVFSKAEREVIDWLIKDGLVDPLLFPKVVSRRNPFAPDVTRTVYRRPTWRSLNPRENPINGYRALNQHFLHL